MKRKIIFGSLLSVFLMLMIPSVPAVEYNNVLEASESRLLAEIKNMDIRELKERIQDLNTKQLKEKILNIDVNEFKEKIQNRDIENKELKEKVTGLAEKLKDNLFLGLGLIGLIIIVFFLIFLVATSIPIIVFFKYNLIPWLIELIPLIFYLMLFIIFMIIITPVIVFIFIIILILSILEEPSWLIRGEIRRAS